MPSINTRQIAPKPPIHAFNNIPPSFIELERLAKATFQGLKPAYDRYDFMGGRLSAKTQSIIRALGKIALTSREPVVIYAFRYKVKDIYELLNEFVITYKPFARVMRVNRTRSEIRIYNTLIRFKGLQTNEGRDEAQLTGMTSSHAKYAFIFLEEAFQFSQKDINDILEATRGADFRALITATNPWSSTNEFVAELLARKEPEVNLMRQKGEDIYAQNMRYIHYSNWRVNPFIKPADLAVIKRVAEMDPVRARVVDLGLAGMTKGAIYAHAMTFTYASKVQIYREYSAGLDLGFTRDLTAMVLVGVHDNYRAVDFIAEYGYDNSIGHFESNIIAYTQGIIHTLRLWIARWRIPQLTLWADSANLANVLIINQELQRAGLAGIVTCAPVEKIQIEQRVSAFTQLMYAGRIGISLECKQLIKDLDNATWEQTKSIKPRRNPEIPDHYLNGAEYAVIPLLPPLLTMIERRELWEMK